ncbi:MAG: hypothetical protein JST92_00165, partial [Deltaproteobacteria bacterium]|nr:hypothetical protein [Deltaproteobacteria bacterium]
IGLSATAAAATLRGIRGPVPGPPLAGINGVSPSASSGLSPAANCVPVVGSAAPIGTVNCAGSTLGYNPVGGYMPGAVSRDAGSFGLELLSNPRVRASGKLELRFDKADSRLVNKVPGVFDRTHLLANGDASVKANDDLSVFLRANYADSRVADQPNGDSRSEALWIELTAGLALRPVSWDVIAVLFKATHLVDQRPLDLTSSLSDEQMSDVLSISPTFELPYGFALAEKLAWKHTRATLADSPTVDTNLWLWVNRLDWHATKQFDFSGEYRMLLLRSPSSGSNGIGGQTERGVLLETAFRPSKYARLGVGWNFTDFSDDELARYDHTAGGLFVRAIGEF